MFLYDIADFYKENLTIDLSFSIASKIQEFNKKQIIEEFKTRISDFEILEYLHQDIIDCLGETK
jgi:CRISPR-associated protein Cas1